MLSLIVQHSEALTHFILALHLALSQLQIQHLREIVDALLVCHQRKTLSGLSHLLHRTVPPKVWADFFRESPWRVDLIHKLCLQFMPAKVLERAQAAGVPLTIQVSLDDSLGKKGKGTKHLEAVGHHHNHTERTRQRASWCNGDV